MVDTSAPEPGDPGKLDGQVAIVTGAGRGIGRAIATELASQGALVIVADVDGALAAQTAGTLARAGHHALNIMVDVSQQSMVEQMVSEALAQGGHIDILVNNAGLSRATPALEMSYETWQRSLDVNLTGAFLCSQAAGRHMAARGYGRIVNISSTSGQFGAPGLAAYAASKAGLLGLTRVMAVELGAYGITVNAVCPGNIQTEMLLAVFQGRALQRSITPDELLEGILSKTPAGRLGHPEEVAGMVAFLASPANGYITGQAINVCGGRSINLS